ncbi:hypothetical protein ZEAMMB73_Zm00001d035420 [Zea mays]|uniref:Uncharacterized protein n=1 Tax=Zea mays TaxID=4577 RepID=A0A1D6LGB9_MAIZE|nr:hypothetical protein ZEAMMB73_Zm00001d035420 [Zea mays]
MPDSPAARSTAEFRDDIEQGPSTPDDAPSNPPSPNALPNAAGSTTGNQHGSAEEAPTPDAPSNSLNDGGTATDWDLPTNEIISLRKRIKNIEYIVSETNKSPLSKHSSSSTKNEIDDKESSSTKNSGNVRSTKQKEIDYVYRSIEKKVKVFGRDKVHEDIRCFIMDRLPMHQAPTPVNLIL